MADAFVIRLMKASDVQTIYEIQNAVYPLHYLEDELTIAQRLAAFPGGHFVACDSATGDPVGYAIAYPWILAAARVHAPSLGNASAAAAGIAAALAVPGEQRCAFLHEVTLRAAVRRIGIGKKLLRACVEAAARGGARSSLCVAVMGKAPIWRGLGFSVIQTLPWGYYSGGGSGSGDNNNLFTMREVLVCEREALRAWVCDAHVAASGYNEESKAAQIADLPDDFPDLFCADIWSSLVRPSAWIVEDAKGWVAAVGLKPSASLKDAEDISYLFVALRARRRGLAQSLLRTAKGTAAARGATALRLVTLPGVYDEAITLYEKEGFFQYQPDEITPLGHFNLRWLQVKLVAAATIYGKEKDASAASEDLSAQVMEARLGEDGGIINVTISTSVH